MRFLSRLLAAAFTVFSVFFLVFFVAFDTNAETPPSGLICRDSLVSMTVDGKEKVESTRLCVNVLTRPSGKPQIQAIASENCVSPKPNASACVALRKAQDATFRTATSSVDLIASPTFDLCLRLGGEPSSLKFQLGGTWHVTDRCLFTEDYSYIDTRSLSRIGESPFKHLQD